MLVCYTGLPGSGKSAHAARDIRHALLRHGFPRLVIANFELSPDAPIPDERRRFYHYVPNEEMDDQTILRLLREYWTSKDCPFDSVQEDWVLLIIDEAQVSHNSRTWGQRGRQEFLNFLTQSRHYGVKVILISQALTMIDKQYRDLIDLEYEHRRLKNLTWLMAPVEWLVGGCLTTVIKRMVRQKGERVSSDICRYGPKDFVMYDSYNTIKMHDFSQDLPRD